MTSAEGKVQEVLVRTEEALSPPQELYKGVKDVLLEKTSTLSLVEVFDINTRQGTGPTTRGQGKNYCT